MRSSTATYPGTSPGSCVGGPIGPHRRWGWARTTLGDVKRVRAGLGGTVNDVVLTSITKGFRNLLLARGAEVEGQVVRSLVPVSVRREDERGTYNNRVSAMFAELPVGIEDPVKRLAAIREQMDDLKEKKQAVAAEALTSLSGQPVLASWTFLGRAAEVTPVKLVMGVLILGFSAFELVPGLRSIQAPVRWLPVGGALSGFFGGLSGHQGALRAVFLSPLRLSPAQFASTQAVIALLVDAARLLVYGWSFLVLAGAAGAQRIPWHLVAVASLCAFAGAYLGKRLLPRMTLGILRWVVGVLLLLVGSGLVIGVV